MVVFQNNADITISFVNDNSQWIFGDFDKIFSSVKLIIGTKQTGYDLFGHSAGGKILHRYAIFKKNSKANRIVAVNSGGYTLPDLTTNYPLGTNGTPILELDINESFSNQLIQWLCKERIT